MFGLNLKKIFKRQERTEEGDSCRFHLKSYRVAAAADIAAVAAAASIADAASAASATAVDVAVADYSDSKLQFSNKIRIFKNELAAERSMQNHVSKATVNRYK